MKLEEVIWYELESTEDRLARIYAFTKYLPDKIITMFSSKNCEFFDMLAGDNASYIVARGIYYKDLLESRHAPFLAIRNIKIKHTITNLAPIPLKITSLLSDHFREDSLDVLNDSWDQLLQLRGKHQKIRLNDKDSFNLFRSLAVILKEYVKLLIIIIGKALKPVLDFLNMALLYLEQIKHGRL